MAELKRSFSRKNMVVLYTVFVIIPILIADILIVSGIYRSDKEKQQHLMENEASAVHSTFENQVEQAMKLGNTLYTSQYVDQFLSKEYSSDVEYYEAKQFYLKNTLLNTIDGQSGLRYAIYQNNPTITEGAPFRSIRKIEYADWYRHMCSYKRDQGIYFGDHSFFDNSSRRAIYYYQRLNYFDKKSKNVVLIEIAYSKCSDILANLNYENKAYICDGSRVLLSTEPYSDTNMDYKPVDELQNIAYTEKFSSFDQNLTINVEAGADYDIFERLKNKWYQVISLALMNILLPLFVSDLMHNDLENKLNEQDMMVARQNAELLALHSQINPHFLFNALESIRMHSLIKDEIETSQMVEHLAKLQRQYTQWHDDNIEIEHEMEFVDAYLQLQKYRFADRLSFDVEVADDCYKLFIPKLSIVTFVENACVHGIENKTSPGWIFVRVFRKDDYVTIEIEDTGSGISEEHAKKMLDNMRNANIDMLKTKGRVGIVNACLRLKMLSNNEVVFKLDSEPGTGTLVQIIIPAKYLKGVI